MTSRSKPRRDELSSVPTWARQLTRLLDGAIRVPGTDIRIGLDPILGALLPEVGDALTGVLALALLGVAYRERVPRWVLLRMLLNIGLDALLGSVPLIGDLFDFVFKANDKNLALIERHRGDPGKPAKLADKLIVVGALVAALLLALLPLLVGVALWRLLVSASR